MIIGFGNMGKLHYSKLISKGINIPIIVDSNIKNIDVDAQVYPNLEEVPSFENIDFIFICTPTNTHFEILNKVISNKIPIFLEKPAVRTLDEIEKLRKIKDVFIFVGEVELYNPDFQEFMNYNSIPSGIIINRKVDLNYFLKGNKPWFLDEKLSGGIVLDLMIHDITLLISKFGIPIIKSVEFSKNIFEINDFAKVILDFGDFETEIISSWIEKDNERPIKVSIEILNKQDKILIISDNYMKEKEADAFDYQLDEFLKGIHSGKFPYNLDLFLDATKICLDINDIIKSKL